MFSLETPAKVNLFLNVRNPRPDGFHDVCFLLQTLDLSDTLTVAPWLNESDIIFSCNDSSLADFPERNLVVKAYRLFFKKTGLPPLGLKVHLDKAIPMQAGLGGGSSNAAGMLKALNELTQNPLSELELMHLGAELGSDVPFFLIGGTAVATGRGEEITEVSLPKAFEAPVVVVKDKTVHTETRLAYQWLRDDRNNQPNPPYLSADGIVAAVLQDIEAGQGSFSHTEALLLNDFEEPVLTRNPALLTIADKLKASGVSRPLLCGSGSAMMGFLADTPENRQKIHQQLPMDLYEVFWTRTSGGVSTMNAPVEVNG